MPIRAVGQWFWPAGKRLFLSALSLQILSRRMPVYTKRFRNRIGRLALCSQASDLITQFGGEPAPPPPLQLPVSDAFDFR